MLCDGHRALNTLPRRLRARLERTAFIVRRHLTHRRLRLRHGQASLDALRAACASSGVSCCDSGEDHGVLELAFQKPSVLLPKPLLPHRPNEQAASSDLALQAGAEPLGAPEPRHCRRGAPRLHLTLPR